MTPLTERFSLLRRAFILAALLLVASGCATVANYESMLQSWIGQDARRLVGAWGPPSSVFEVDRATKLYTWDADFGTIATPIYYSTITTSMRCRTTFTVDGGGTVTGWRHEGNRCKALPPNPSNTERVVAERETDTKPVARRLEPVPKEVQASTEAPASRLTVPAAAEESELSRQYAFEADNLAQELYESYRVNERDLRLRGDESSQERFHRLVTLEASLAGTER